MSADAWPGVFTRHLLHRVRAANAERIAAPRGSARYGLADCGAVCTPATGTGDRRYCEACWPSWPEPATERGLAWPGNQSTSAA